MQHFSAAISAVALALAASTHAVSAIQCIMNANPAPLPLNEAMTCQRATNILLVAITTLPTPTQAKEICTKCPDLVAALETTVLQSCTILLANLTVIAVDTFVATVSSQCNSTTTTTTTPPPPPSTSITGGGSFSGASTSSSSSASSAHTPTPTNTSQVTGSSLGPIDILLPTTTKPTTTSPSMLPMPSIGVRSATLGGGGTGVAFAFACAIAALAL